ncbi:hypothetical protein NPIL_125191 [Nephila pilipes]|uniref:Uncharacterized protein n=1 Tax=Nephila pilipes TaxID=299642 RepID=A0A8X6JDC5_NEPPI|nr:hypothetical protein NPIL_125191 [Nephila pilipes]
MAGFVCLQKKGSPIEPANGQSKTYLNSACLIFNMLRTCRLIAEDVLIFKSLPSDCTGIPVATSSDVKEMPLDDSPLA